MKKYFANLDWSILMALFVLLILGLFAIASVAPQLFLPQTLYAFLGLGLFFLFSQLDYRVLERLVLFIFSGSIGLLLLTFLFGTITRGTVRWIQIGGFTVQPSEMVKPFLVVFFAWFFSHSQMNLRRFLAGGLLLLLPFILVVWQPDLGSSLVIAFSWLGIVLGAGLAWPLLGLSTAATIIGFPLVWRLLREYQRQRVLSFLNPLSDPLGAGYNLIQATITVGSGQLLGRGFGRGTQSHLRFLPERQTDFIFASFAEELGFIGSMILLVAFGFLLWRILVIARETKDPFGYLICLGVFSMLSFQVFVNIGMNLGLLPITGITLPLISYGGSSLVGTMISLGLVESVARRNRKREVVEIR